MSVMSGFSMTSRALIIPTQCYEVATLASRGTAIFISRWKRLTKSS